jgi:hypothetical protein
MIWPKRTHVIAVEARETMNIKWLTRGIIGMGVIATVICLSYAGLWEVPFISALAVFIVWLMSPYIVWALINEYRRGSLCRNPRAYIAIATAIPIIGLGMESYVLLHPDPQAGFYFLYIPFMQFVSLAILWIIC